MAVTKRTRFEVLRRDEHTCQYCGAKAPDVTLQIDHVVPVSLGGNDKPENLVTACRDCNTGKSSIAPDAPLAQKLSAEASAYALGMVDKMTRFRADVERADELIEQFDEEWGGWTVLSTGEKIPLPLDYELSLFRWAQMGVPFRVIQMAIAKAMAKTGLRGEYSEFQYLAGIVWNMVNEREIDYSVTEETAATYTRGEVEGEIVPDAYEKGHAEGFGAGWNRRSMLNDAMDHLSHHIDGTEMVYAPDPFSGREHMTGGVRIRGERVRPTAA